MSQHVLVIAEAGVNHNGSIEIAKKLVDKAVEAGADIIKFQTFKAEKLVARSAKQAEYQKKNISVLNTMINIMIIMVKKYLMKNIRKLVYQKKNTIVLSMMVNIMI